MASKPTSKRSTAARPAKSAPKKSTQRRSTASKAAKPTGSRRTASEGSSKAAPPAASVAAAQKVLRAIERREVSLDTKLKRDRQTIKALKRSAADHREAVKLLKVDLKKVRKMRKSVSSEI